MNHFKKEGIEDCNRPVIFDELHSLLSDCKDSQTRSAIPELTSIIKKTFGSIFFIEYNYTFEELIFKIKRFDKECENIFKKIDNLNEQKEDFILKSKKNKKDKDFLSKFENLNKKIESENNTYNSCRLISKTLEGGELKNKIVSFCDRLSVLKFSSQEVSKKEFTKIVFDFLWIVNQLHHPYASEKGAGLLEKIEHKIDKVFRLSDKQKDSVQISELPELIIKAETALEEDDLLTAKEAYEKILTAYKQAPSDLRELIYKQLFEIWFRLHFYDNHNS